MATSDATKNEWIALQTCTPDDGIVGRLLGLETALMRTILLPAV